VKRNEAFEQAMRYVGQLQCLDAAAKSVHCLPRDKTTAELIDTIRTLTNKAVLRAWEYADSQDGEP